MRRLPWSPPCASAARMMSAADALVNVHDTPTLLLKVARGTRQEYNMPGLAALLASYAAVGGTICAEPDCMVVASRVYAARQAAHVSSVHCVPRACSRVQSSAASTVS
jgi:hypothetical protein